MEFIKNKQQMDEAIKKGVVVVDFYADWCGPCKMMGPILEQYSKDQSKVKVFKANVDNLIDLAEEHKVMSIPTTFVFKDGVKVGTKMGYMPKDKLEAFVSESIK